MYGAKINIESDQIRAKIRNFYHDLFKVNKLRLQGKIVLAVLNRTSWCSWHKSILLAGGLEREPIDIVVASTPMKQYFNLRGTADHTSVVGKALGFFSILDGPCIAQKSARFRDEI